jgi:hypothetical protein
MVFQGISQGFIKESGSTTRRAKRVVPRTLRKKMKTAYKNSAARLYLAFMAETASAAIGGATENPKRIEGGCLLYTMPNSRSQQHPPTPYYS